MLENKWCFNCGYPLKGMDKMGEGGAHYTFYDGKTGNVTDDCPNCHNWPLAVYGIESKESTDALLQRLEPWQGNDRAEEWAS